MKSPFLNELKSGLYFFSVGALLGSSFIYNCNDIIYDEIKAKNFYFFRPYEFFYKNAKTVLIVNNLNDDRNEQQNTYKKYTSSGKNVDKKEENKVTKTKEELIEKINKQIYSPLRPL